METSTLVRKGYGSNCRHHDLRGGKRPCSVHPQERYPAYPPSVHKALAALDCEKINYDLIVQVQSGYKGGASKMGG